MPHEVPDPQSAALEAALRSLTPLPDRIERDRLMFRAGQASVPRRGWLWPSSTAAMSLVAAILGGLLLQRPPLRLEPPTMPLAGSPAMEHAETPDYLRLRQLALGGDMTSLSSPLSRPTAAPQETPFASPSAPDVETPSLLGRGAFTKL